MTTLVGQKGLSEEVTFKLKPEGEGKGVSRALWGDPSRRGASMNIGALREGRAPGSQGQKV